MKNPCFLQRLLIIVTAVSVLCACQDEPHWKDERTPEAYQRYQELNDSMQHLTPHALSMIEEAMQQADDSLTWYDYYLMYGKHYLIAEHHDSVMPYIRRTLDFVSRQEQTPRTRGLQATATSLLASHHYLLHQNTDSVIALYQQAYQLMMQSDLTVNLPDLSANLGDAYIAKEDLSNASKWYRRALFLNDSLALPTEHTFTLYMGLGRIYTMLRNYDEAQHYYSVASRHFDQMKPNMQSYFLNNYGNFYYYKKDYEQALQTFLRFKRHLIQHHAEKNFDMYLCYINLADVYLNIGKADSAQLYVALAEPYFQSHHIGVGQYYAQTIRLGVAIQQKRYDEARHIIAEDVVETNDVDMKRIRNRYLRQYYAATGDYRKAYQYMEERLHTGDSTRNEIQHMRTNDILTRLAEDTIRLHHQLEMQQREVQYAKTRVVTYAVVALLIILLLAFALWYNYIRKRRLQEQLDIQNLRLANVRQRVSPHFVFNVLNSRINKTNQEEADQLMMLAQLIRTNLDLTRKNVVTLAEELQFVKQYVSIERQLIGEAFDFDIEAPAEEVMEQIYIPSMLVQILVENAIVHGLKNKEGHKQLTIRVTTDDEETRISVIDNGPGFDIRQYTGNRARTGLHIIRSTVNILNQENNMHKMRFDIRNDNGCQATLTIPKNIKYTQL